MTSGAMLEKLPAWILFEQDLSPKIHPFTQDYGHDEYCIFPGKHFPVPSHHPQWGFAVQKLQSVIAKQSS